ncbi:ATP-dependent protease ATPase subunit HslU [Brachyspira hyodysenteriae]|uniref:ATP-dependent protease ATPase subunit HslU n=2 Tax=Brachyspira hyodysenteriae TaxID=159 RepID=A0A3B6VHA1_BRAHW|nr:ATP-dependent protease ATPase subunit HslU [Brachyspira hyodysenteriae]ACN84624.1 ATP-dependent protease HslVU (ClpYQ), ATPase subunit [Brachyspira hyodysenteriae WA1]ANN63301.1 HslU--HslV peptidase ATPase subunit [Brachyspira hyodysenteriae ATCC 27164]AUJ50359.1 ATP-dependent protease ATP-binding subunit HslU [Brachyspira hyodysenteriae]KLI13885.1 ATP-dependent protease [Brachyspira hyodysenteriae]KLI14565.1 ATP-dependent protease [Brachyspira hyodysenteriae]
MSFDAKLESELTPRKIVEALDQYIIGQTEAKRSVAIALRNRYRRRHLPDELRDEVAPKNIILIGPTGVGKTEIARRLAKLVNAPFIKVEATKYTEVGYVGRDVESMVRDLVNVAIFDLKTAMMKEVEKEATEIALDKLAKLLLPSVKKENDENISEEEAEKKKNAKEQIKKRIQNGDFDESYVEIKISSGNNRMFGIIPGMGFEESDMIQSMVGSIMPTNKKHKRLRVKEAKKYLINEASESLIDMDKITSDALSLTENMGIIFLDEIDKIASGNKTDSADVARHGVQRDLLPIVEGTTVNTRYGPVKTDHILFIAAGAFHINKPSDLIPELQGRFPIRVELKALSKDDFKDILVNPKNAITKQYQELLKTEGVTIEFEEEALSAIADIAYNINTNVENIGARRLYTIMEKVFEEISFSADEHKGEFIKINADNIKESMKDIEDNRDISRYIL